MLAFQWTTCRLFTHLGCKCCFVITRFADWPGAIQITWNQQDPIDKDNHICHGMLDQTAFGVNAHISPRLSRKIRLSIECLLRAGLIVKAILHNHMEEVVSKFRKENSDEDEPGKWSRDMQLTTKDIQTIREAWRSRQGDYTNDDATTVKSWVHRNLELVHIY